MAWKDELRQASFRGVPFYVDTSKKDFGRRAIVHEFPNRETNSTQDNGKIAEGYDLECFVLGDNYLADKKALEDALNEKGPGELIHPYYGTLFVQVGPASVTETWRNGGVAIFTCKFFNAGDNRFPRAVNDKGAVLESSSEAMISSAKSEFDNSFSVRGLPSFAIESARSGIALAGDTFNNVTSELADNAAAATETAYSIRSLVAETNDLLLAPSQLSQRLLDSYNLLDDAITSADDRFNGFKEFFRFGEAIAVVTGQTPVRVQEKKNQDALNNFMRKVAIAKAASTAQEVDYPSIEEAEERRDEIVVELDDQAAITEDPDAYQTIIDTKAALVVAVPDVDSDLPSIKQKTLQSTMNSLTLTYELFQRADQEAGLIARNKIKNPAFISAGQTVAYLDGAL